MHLLNILHILEKAIVILQLADVHQKCAEKSPFEKYNNNPRYSEEYVFINGNRLFTDGSGDWPISLFEEKPSYEYKGLNRNLDLTDREDLVFIKKLIKGMGFDIYIRDVTFLNLNTYHIVVPGMSQVSLKLSHYTVLNDTLDKLRLLRGVKNLDVEQLKDLCNYINRDYLLLKKLKFLDSTFKCN